MRQPKVRNTVSLGEKHGYASYRNYMDSVVDLLLWFQSHSLNVPDNVTNYVREIKVRGYFEADFDTYLNGVKHYL